MSYRVNLLGEVIGHLTVIREAPKRGRSYYWLCRCVCGKETSVQTSNLRAKATTSCGCKRYDFCTTHGYSSGGKDTPEYSVWMGMRRRCNDTTHPKYKHYGGRGISITKDWDDPAVFVRDMGPRPSLKHSIDRVDVEGDYCKENCRWSTNKEQSNNRRNNHIVTYLGESLTISEWATKLGFTYATLSQRFTKLKWDAAKALTTPHTARNRRVT